MIEMEDLQASSDQMNAVDFVQPVTFKVSSVKYFPKQDQPVHLHMEGYDGRPYKPSKGMLRGLTQSQVWGRDEQQWVGKLITLYCDPTVKWAGKEAGGIRISAVSGIKERFRFALTLNRSQRILHAFDVIPDNTEVKKVFVKTHYIDDIENAETDQEISVIVATVSKEFGPAELEQIKETVVTAREKLKQAEGEKK